MIDNIDIASYGDDNTTDSVRKSQCDLETKLKNASIKLFKSFYENGLKSNQDKSNFLSSLDIDTKFLLPGCILENSLTNMLPTYVIRQAKKFKHSQECSQKYLKHKNYF